MDRSDIKSNDMTIEKIDLKKEEAEEVRFINMKQIDSQELMEMWDQYATKKTATSGFFNMALMANNFMTLRKTMTSSQHKHGAAYTWIDIMIIAATCFSILMQLFAGLVLIFLGRNNLAGNDRIRQALTKNNDLVTTVVFGIFIVNLAINIFSMAE